MICMVLMSVNLYQNIFCNVWNLLWGIAESFAVDVAGVIVPHAGSIFSWLASCHLVASSISFLVQFPEEPAVACRVGLTNLAEFSGFGCVRICNLV
jgi:hypothetical protein